MIIGVDLDDVLATYSHAIIAFHNAVYGTKLTRSQFISYMFSKVWGGTQADTDRKVTEFCKSEFFNKITPIAGSQEAIARLKELHELHVITSRQASLQEATLSWLERYFPGTFASVSFSNDYHKTNGSQQTKLQLCTNLCVEVLVDDLLQYAIDCASTINRVLLFDAPWNQCDGLPANVQRISSWEDALKILT